MRDRPRRCLQSRHLWAPDPSCLVLLESLGGPFETGVYRDCLVRASPEWRDVGFCAVAPDGARAALALALRGGPALSAPHRYGGGPAGRGVAPPPEAAIPFAA